MSRRFQRTIIKAFLLSAPFLFLLSAPAIAGKKGAVLQINYEPVKEAMSLLIWNEMKKNDITGLSIALVDDQRIVWAQGFGYADERNDIAATPETVYRIGTLTKLFTAFATMQLAEQGRLNLDRPLKTYLPEFAIRSRFSGKALITIRNLLTHHSGLPSDFQKGMWSKRPAPYTTVKDLIRDEYTAYPPGFIYSYSNIGYDLLGSVMERVNGEDFTQQIRTALLRPLNMRHSGFTPPAATWLMSKGYFKGAEAEDPPLRDLPAGGMYSTVLDMARFMEMIFANGRHGGREIMKPKTLAETMQEQNGNVPLDLGLRTGLGWLLGDLGEVDIRNAGTVAHHAGATLLFRSQLIVLPQHRLGVVVMANSSAAGRTVGKVAAHTLELALETKTGIKQPFDERSPEVDGSLPQDVLNTYPGQYASLVGIAEITAKQDHMLLDAIDKTLKLVPHANGTFGLKYVLLGLFPISLAALDEYELSYAKIAGHEILKASSKGSELLVAEKIHAARIPQAWLDRRGTYTIENLGDDVPVFENIRLRSDNGWLLLECSMPYFLKAPFRFPLKIVSDTEATIAGLGRGMGETLRVVQKNGKERLSYSGYLLRKEQ